MSLCDANKPNQWLHWVTAPGCYNYVQRTFYWIKYATLSWYFRPSCVQIRVWLYYKRFNFLARWRLVAWILKTTPCGTNWWRMGSLLNLSAEIWNFANVWQPNSNLTEIPVLILDILAMQSQQNFAHMRNFAVTDLQIVKQSMFRLSQFRMS